MGRRNNYQKDWYQANKARCLAVNKANHFKRKYGITVEKFEKMLKQQKYVCKICGLPETVIEHKSGKVRTLSVDHCHTTGMIRGLLCGRCNLFLGRINDDIELLKNAIKYLRKHKKHVDSDPRSHD